MSCCCMGALYLGGEGVVGGGFEIYMKNMEKKRAGPWSPLKGGVGKGAPSPPPQTPRKFFRETTQPPGVLRTLGTSRRQGLSGHFLSAFVHLERASVVGTGRPITFCPKRTIGGGHGLPHCLRGVGRGGTGRSTRIRQHLSLHSATSGRGGGARIRRHPAKWETGIRQTKCAPY